MAYGKGGADTKKSVSTGSRNTNPATGMSPKNTDCCPNFGKPIQQAPAATKGERDTVLKNKSVGHPG